MRQTVLASLFAVAAFALDPASAAPAMPMTAQSDHPLAGRIVETATGRALSGPAALVEALADVDIALLGEVHDNADHHAAQAWLTESLSPAGLAFEMIPAEAEGRLARLRAAGAARAVIGAALEWEARGWPDFAMYAPILEAAPAAQVTGGEVPREALGLAMGHLDMSAATTLGAAAGRYGLDAPLPEAETEAIAAEMRAAHCDAIPMEAARGMVGAQRLRDAALADAALRARAYGANGYTIVIAGNGHARRDRGAPAYIAAARADVTVAALGLLETQAAATDWRDYAGPGGDAAALYDYIWFTAPAPREDPCVAFRARQ